MVAVTATLTVESLHRYPVKSMLGEAVDACELGPAGLAGDRAYAVVDSSDGFVASAKNPAKWGALLGFRATFTDEPALGGTLPPVTVTFPDGSQVRSDEREVHDRLSRAIGREVTLVSVAPGHPVFEEVWPDIAGLAPTEFIERVATGRNAAGETVSRIDLAMGAPGTFFDLAPLHVLTTATLSHLSALVPGATYDVRRYRPNVVVAVPDAGFVEDSWVGRSVGLGAQAEAVVLMSTMRCVMTTLAQDGLPRDRSTLRGIAEHNRVDIPGLGTWACAGVYAGVAAPGKVRVGDPVVVASEGSL